MPRREPTPSAVCIESQSVKTTEMGGPERGYDGGKKINGRKRHLLVDTLGLLLAVLITSARLDDGVAAPLLLGHVHSLRSRRASLNCSLGWSPRPLKVQLLHPELIDEEPELGIVLVVLDPPRHEVDPGRVE